MDDEHIGLMYKIALDLIRTNKLCKQFIGSSPDDYLGLCYIALQKAKKNFVPGNTQFSTYATEVIKDQVIEQAYNNSTLIRVAPAYRYQAWRVINGKEKTQGSKKSINAAVRVFQGKTTKLDPKLFGEEKPETWVDQDQIDKLFTFLDEREKQILILRYGLLDNSPKNLYEIGQIMNLSRERVRQIQKESLRKLRKNAII